MVEHLAVNQGVGGSIPSTGAIFLSPRSPIGRGVGFRNQML